MVDEYEFTIPVYLHVFATVSKNSYINYPATK